jgi:hypothetical protein
VRKQPQLSLRRPETKRGDTSVGQGQRKLVGAGHTQQLKCSGFGATATTSSGQAQQPKTGKGWFQINGHLSKIIVCYIASR